MAFVIDTSVLAAWLLPDEMPPAALDALARLEHSGAFAPAILWYEVRNLLISNEKRGRLSKEQADTALSRATALPITLDHTPETAATIALARTYRLTIYDAAYLELALRRGVPLVTLDAALARAAAAKGVLIH
ncbi:MAG: type II toxin-antitoxin system VapC family toxin [Hyphomicrobiales bacterium]|nr:type II toxin-antitoxin system VapC family toxin [Hyphomicrobiales bacterium]